MAHERPSIDDQAIAWTIASRDPLFDDWEALTEWLEADQGHAASFQRLAALDASLPDLLRQVRPAAAPVRLGKAEPRSSRFRRFGSMAAVGIVALFSAVLILRPGGYVVTTEPGERRVIALSDGSEVALNGDTEVRLYKDNPRLAELERGEASFVVAHDAGSPFVVHVGDAVVEDAGTAFNIIRTDTLTEVGVSEGEVIFNPGKENIALKRGFGVRQTGNAGPLRRFSVPPNTVGGWRRGQLSYAAAPLDRIADDVSRALGIKVSVAPSARAMRFTGTLWVEADARSFFANAAPLMGVKAQSGATGWVLTASDVP